MGPFFFCLSLSPSILGHVTRPCRDIKQTRTGRLFNSFAILFMTESGAKDLRAFLAELISKIRRYRREAVINIVPGTRLRFTCFRLVLIRTRRSGIRAGYFFVAGEFWKVRHLNSCEYAGIFAAGDHRSRFQRRDRCDILATKSEFRFSGLSSKNLN